MKYAKKKNLYLLLLLFIGNMVQAQFSCDNIELIGIYYNNRNTDQLSMVITNKSVSDDGNQNVYTSFQIVTELGDTLLSEPPCQCYSLPNNKRDTFVYNIKLHENYRTIYDLPDSFCGKIITAFPDCEIPFCKNEIVHPDLTQATTEDCSDYKVIGLYETAHGGISNYSFLLTYTNENFKGIGLTGYTSFEFFDNNQQSLSEPTGPSFTLPQFVQDTIIVHMNFHDRIDSNLCMILKTALPDCEIEYCYTLLSSSENIDLSRVVISPNPTNGLITIESDYNIDQIKILNSKGQLIKVEKSNYFNIQTLPSGLYYLAIKFKNKEKITRKIFKN